MKNTLPPFEVTHNQGVDYVGEDELKKKLHPHIFQKVRKNYRGNPLTLFKGVRHYLLSKIRV